MITAFSSESAYFLARAKQEQSRAENSEHPKAAAIHRELAVRYSAKALLLHVEEDPSSDVIHLDTRRATLQRRAIAGRRTAGGGRRAG